MALQPIRQMTTPSGGMSNNRSKFYNSKTPSPTVTESGLEERNRLPEEAQYILPETIQHEQSSRQSSAAQVQYIHTEAQA